MPVRSVNGPERIQLLAAAAPALERALAGGVDEVTLRYGRSEIRRETVWVTMRDGARLATDLYCPPVHRSPAILIRTPYGRGNDRLIAAFQALARSGYVIVSQDCRGTGESEPDSWDYYVREPEDSFDLVDWAVRQEWFQGFLGACGGSYLGQTQWCMSVHPRMSAIAPEVSGLGVARNTTHLHMTINAYARSVGKGVGKVAVDYKQLERLMLEETLAGGYFNEPIQQPFPEQLLACYPVLRSLPRAKAGRWLWERYCNLSCVQRAAFIKMALGRQSVSIAEVESLQTIFGHQVSHDAHTLPYVDPTTLAESFHAPALMITGWYDWGLNDALATWDLLRQHAKEAVRFQSRLIISPGAHNLPGYHEGMCEHPELGRTYRTENVVSLLLLWFAALREGRTCNWPRVIYYLLGENEWRVSAEWPPPEAQGIALFLGAGGKLNHRALQQQTEADQFTYDPENPTPTVGGSILSSVYPVGSVDVSEVQKRFDVLTYTSAPLDDNLDVVGPVRVILYASSSALDTDFSARLSDVFPDGRAIQLQSGILRARYRNISGDPENLEPARIYRFEIDLWATANRFKKGHQLRLDVSSADFPRFDRNSNRGGEPGAPVAAVQTIYHDPEHPSHIVLSVLGSDDGLVG
jgi:predicted acyl esterase